MFPRIPPESSRASSSAFRARLADLARVDYQPVDVEAATRDALAYLERFREVLKEGTLEQRKEFLRGFVVGIAIDPDAARGTIVFYELPAGSLMMVPGARVELSKTGPSRRDGFGLPLKDLGDRRSWVEASIPPRRSYNETASLEVRYPAGQDAKQTRD